MTIDRSIYQTSDSSNNCDSQSVSESGLDELSDTSNMTQILETSRVIHLLAQIDELERERCNSLRDLQELRLALKTKHHLLLDSRHKCQLLSQELEQSQRSVKRHV